MPKDPEEIKLQEALAAVKKLYGEGAVMQLGSDARLNIEVIPTSSLAVDIALGIGGMPRGRVVEIYGPECLAETTFVQYTTVVNGKRANSKGGTIKRLYERFHKLSSSGDGRGKYRREVTQDAEFFAPSVNELGRIISNKIKNVVHSGPKRCFRVLAEGHEILASEDHKFLQSTGQYVALKDLDAGDKIMLHLIKVVPKIITNIEIWGTLDTYDIQMESPYNNFVANQFVVHNSGGKTTLTLHIIAEAQKMGGRALFIDAEHALDPTYARKLGVNTDTLMVSQPDNGEQALEIAELFIRSGAVDVVVVDSVAALVPRGELEGNMGQPTMGLQARLMSQALRKLTAVTSKSKTCLIFINQVRDKIGVMFGNPETTTGGRALKFYASIRIDIRRMSTMKDGDDKYGNKTKVVIKKNKCAAPFKEAEIEIIYGEGISHEADLISLGIANGLIEQKGSWFSYNGERLGQGEDSVRNLLQTQPEIANVIETTLREKYFGRKE